VSAALGWSDWKNWHFGTVGTDVSVIRLERSAAVERLEQFELGSAYVSEAVELLERLERTGVLPGAKRLRINPLMVSPSNHWNDWNKLSWAAVSDVPNVAG